MYLNKYEKSIHMTYSVFNSIRKILAAVLIIGFFASCGGSGSDENMDQQQLDSIKRAHAAMEAAREAALIKARIEDSLENLQMTDSINGGYEDMQVE
jgi:hypothetical protein